jgi:anti-sigma regulatory factor (Ser/Thr protein kinase)
MPVMLDLNLPPGREAPARARRSLEGLAGTLHPDVLDTLRLLVTELVTNSVRHGDLQPSDRIRVSLAEHQDRIRAQVTNPGGSRTPALLEPDHERPSGWGLYLVDQVADRWGVESNQATTVWFELRGN